MKKLLFGSAAAITAITSSISAFAVDYSYSTSTTDDGAIAGMSIIFWCCCAAAAMLVPLALAFFVYKDAQKSGVDNPTLWALVTFFFGLIGILIYFLIGKNNKK